MGHRAKNKQSAPKPLEGMPKPSAKKLGKRKAEVIDDKPSGRPTKRTKDQQIKSNVHSVNVKNDKTKQKKPKTDADAWEDIKDDIDIKAQTRSLFHGSDMDEEETFTGNLNDIEVDEDELLRGEVEEFDFDSDEVELPPQQFSSRIKKSKQAERPLKIIPNASDNSDSDEDSDDDPVTMANMETKSRALEARAAKEAQLDLDEIQAAAEMEDGDDFDMEDVEDDDENGEADGETFNLPTAEEREAERNAGGPDVHVVQRRMRECTRVLQKFKKRAEKGRSRAEYTSQLISDIASYYGYNEFLAEKLFLLFPVAEAIEFFEANEVPRPVTIRTNTLRTRRRDLAQVLINRGVNLEPIGKWTNVGLQVFESSVPIGATPEYLAGHYMLQAASSFLPVIALSPQPGERVLDMASAPGGKTTHIAALLQNTGVVFANDANKARTKSLSANVHRLGCKNVVVCSYDGREFPKVMGGFDRVLLDAPCSGTGVISKDSSVKVNKSERDFTLLAHLQKQLILCALDSVKPESKSGSYVVYSTCSVTVDENEAVVDYALRKRPNVHLVDTGIGFGVEGYTSYRGKVYDKSVKLTRRFYPHVHNMDGFFVAKFKVEKRSKKMLSGDKEQDNVGEETVTADRVDGDGEKVTFDDEEDKPYIEESKRRYLKSKGLRVPPRTAAVVKA
ncbi:rRNA (cytosine-C5-)-methyltransferase nop2 [Marasmius oreades]|uniref:Nucleolar protein 2 n=1 Tax=Marasmius oreades TaxID=181124 RepID=A0A9P7RZM4_9AGAR|nr:rRNA (cytosine-C5-)-methyltransferase nop2 [Marasmius oreades]KAG7092350.1 rRNA (cytosine-C5-)-methyltransferase nop2 [Marasmius oreades]